jgi:AraC-like DNA-binding protein
MSAVIHVMGDSCLLFGEGPRLDVHTPHAFKICVALEGQFRMRLASESAWTPFEAAVIAPDVPHELDGSDALACMLLVGPETAEGRRLASRTILLPARPARGLPSEDPDALRRTLLGLFASRFPTRFVDPRILAALRLIRASPAIHVPVRQIADAVSLSPSRLVHLFHEQTNVSIKRYSLWLRVLAAFRAMNSEDSLTEIAYQVGFADPAHLSRAFRQMVGINPSALKRPYWFGDKNSICIQQNGRSVQRGIPVPAVD